PLPLSNLASPRSSLILLYFTLLFFFFINPPSTGIYTLSLHDALPISPALAAYTGNTGKPTTLRSVRPGPGYWECLCSTSSTRWIDRKSTRLNSSHVSISYAVFCLKKKKIREEDKALVNIRKIELKTSA